MSDWFSAYRKTNPWAEDYSDSQLIEYEAGLQGYDPNEFAGAIGAAQNRGTAGDLGTRLKHGLQKIPEGVVGLGDMFAGAANFDRPFSRAVDWAGEKTGFRPGLRARQDDARFSQGHYAAQQEVNQAWADPNADAWDVAKAYATNPGYSLGQVVESAPSIALGGVYGRGLRALSAGRIGGVAAGAAGEGFVAAGQSMAETHEGVDPMRAAFGAFGAGAGTSLLGYVGGRAAQRAGLVDVDTALAGGAGAGVSPMSFGRRITGSTLAEGVFEEAPQSIQEQMWQNWAHEAPLSEGVARAGVEGAIAGGLMGAGFNVLPGRTRQQLETDQPADLLNPAPAGPVPMLEHNSSLQLGRQLVSYPDGSVGFADDPEAWNMQNMLAQAPAAPVPDTSETEVQSFNFNQRGIPMPVDVGSAIAALRQLGTAPIIDGSPEHMAVLEAGQILQAAGVNYGQQAPQVAPAGGSAEGGDVAGSQGDMGALGGVAGRAGDATATSVLGGAANLPVGSPNPGNAALTPNAQEAAGAVQEPAHTPKSAPRTKTGALAYHARNWLEKTADVSGSEARSALAQDAGRKKPSLAAYQRDALQKLAEADPPPSVTPVHTSEPTNGARGIMVRLLQALPKGRKSSKTGEAIDYAGLVRTFIGLDGNNDEKLEAVARAHGYDNRATAHQHLFGYTKNGKHHPGAFERLAGVAVQAGVTAADAQAAIREMAQERRDQYGLNEDQQEIANLTGAMETGLGSEQQGRMDHGDAAQQGMLSQEMRAHNQGDAAAVTPAATTEMTSDSAAESAADTEHFDAAVVERYGSDPEQAYQRVLAETNGDVAKARAARLSVEGFLRLQTARDVKGGALVKEERQGTLEPKRDDGKGLTEEDFRLAQLDYDHDMVELKKQHPNIRMPAWNEFLFKNEYTRSHKSLFSGAFSTRTAANELRRETDRLVDKHYESQPADNDKSAVDGVSTGVDPAAQRGDDATGAEAQEDSEPSGSTSEEVTAEGIIDRWNRAANALKVSLWDELSDTQKDYLLGSGTWNEFDEAAGEVLDEISTVDGDTQYSEAEGSTSNTVQAVTDAIKAKFAATHGFNRLVKVFATTAEAKASGALSQDYNGKAQGFVKDGKVYLIAENIKPGQEMSVFLHEAGVHVGMEKLLGAKNMQALHNQVQDWAKRNDGSLESKLAKAAVARAGKSSSENQQAEVVAYFVEEAVNAGVEPKLSANPVARWLANFQRWAGDKLRQLLGKKVELSARDLVQLAYGAAQMELANESESITIKAPTAAGSDFDAAQNLFLSAFPTGTGYRHYKYSTSRFVRDARAASEVAQRDIDLDPTVERSVPAPLGAFSGYVTSAKIEKDLYGKPQLVVEFYGKEQNDAGLTQQPALKYTVSEDGELSVYGPPSSSKTYKEFAKRGWAEPATDAEGNKYELSDGGFWTRLTGVDTAQNAATLGDVHARVLAATGADHTGFHWTRTTGATGGTTKRKGAVYFSEASPLEATGTKLKADIKNAVRAGAYHIAFVHDLVEMAKKSLPSAKAWYDKIQAIGHARREAERAAEAIADKAAKLTDDQLARVNSFLMDSTMKEKWGYQPKWKENDVAVDPAFRTRWQALSAAEQEVVDGVFQNGDAVVEKKRALAAVIGGDAALNHFAKMQGPYAPLKRFGNHVVVGKSAELQAAIEAQDDKLVEKLKERAEHYYVAFRDSAGQAELERQAIEKKFPHNYATPKSQFFEQDRELTFKQIAKLRAAVKADKGFDGMGSKVDQLLNDLYISSLAEHHARQSQQTRAGIAGAEADMIRSFMSQGRADASFLSYMEHGADLNDLMYKLHKEARGDAKAMQIFNTLAAHYGSLMDTRETPWQDKAMSLASFWQLVTSPAYFLTNMTQPWMLTLPVLAGKFSYAKAASALWNAYGALKGNLDFDPKKHANLAERKFLELAQLLGVLDIGLDADMGRMEATDSGYAAVDKASEVARKASYMTRQWARKVEVINRVSSGLASYRLARESGMSEQDASDYAVSVLRRTQGDYSGVAAPLLLKKLPKVVTQYRKFQFMQIALLARLAKASLPWEPDAAVRTVARRQLAFVVGHAAAVGGALGLPLSNVVALLVAALGGDDEEPADLERWMRETIGDQTMADLLVKGAPAALGMDLSQRLGMGNTFGVLPFSRGNLNDQKGAKELMADALGPSAGMFYRWVDGVGMMRNGDFVKGTELLLPNGFGNAIKAWRQSSEGVSMRNGDTVMPAEEYDLFAAAARAIGLPLQSETRRHWIQGQVIEIEQFYKGRTSELKKAYVEAAKENDAEAMTELRTQWNKLQQAKRERGLRPQPLIDLIKAPRAQKKRERQTAAGVQYRSTNQRFIKNISTL